MGFKHLSILFAAIAIFIAVYVYDNRSNDQLRDNFSYNLNKWFEKGNYYVYQDLYRVFYVQEILSKEEDNDNNNDDIHIVLLHGFPTSSYDYFKLWSLFTQQATNSRVKSIITFDFIGYGFSDKPADYDYSIFNMADLVDSLLIRLNVTRAHIISHDISDSVVEELLRRENQNQNHFSIVKCVLLNGGIMTSIYKPRLGQDILRTQVVGSIFAKYLINYQVFKWSFAPIFGSLNPPNSSDLNDFYLAIKYNRGNEILPRTIAYMTEREHYGAIWLDALNETAVPVTFIYGPADPINPSDKFPYHMKRELPFVKLAVLSDFVGHYPQVEDPFTVFSIIKNFFFPTTK